MITKQRQLRLLLPFVALLFALSLVIAGCGGTPTPRPQPTFDLDVRPGTEVQVGKGVAIVTKVEPLEKLNLKWSVSGTSEGKLNTDTGEQVVYTAGKKGIDIVVAEGTTASGVPIKQTVTLTVVSEAPPITFTPTPSPTQRVTLTPTPVIITLTYPQGDQFVPCENPARGTYPLDLTDRIWPVVYIGNKYHPQDEGGKAPPMVNGNWSGTVRFGDCTKPAENKGTPFQLIIVTANEAANKAFEKYLVTARDMGFPGMESLPAGFTEHLRIAVTRQ